jgi:hypothetical protein
MKPFSKGPAVFGCLSFFLLLSGCGVSGPGCDSFYIRTSIVQIIASDNNNALVNYAAKNSTAVETLVNDTKSEAEKLAIWEKARRGAVYALDDTISMKSRNRTTRAVTCIGVLYVTVVDTTAQKEIEFKVEQTTDGTMLVSVSPFLF